LGRFLAFDEQTGLLHAEAGATFTDILQTFLPRGWFLPVTPGTKFVTLGGAIACDVHGKNHHRDGSISNFVEEIELLTASGEILNLTRDTPTEFWATVGGMGLTGVILSAKLRLMPVETAKIKATFTRTANLDETLAAFGHDEDFHYSVAWIDCLAGGASLGRSVLIRGQHAKKGDVSDENPLELSTPRNKAVPIEFPDFALNPLSVKAFNALYYAAHPDAPFWAGIKSTARAALFSISACCPLKLRQMACENCWRKYPRPGRLRSLLFSKPSVPKTRRRWVFRCRAIRSLSIFPPRRILSDSLTRSTVSC
jgi:hypothetical protein